MFEIKEYEVVKREVYKYINVEVLEIQLKKKVVLRVEFYGEYKSLPKVEIVELTGEDYDNWGDDDDYLYKKVCEKLGLKSANEPDEEVKEEVNEEVNEEVKEEVVENVLKLDLDNAVFEVKEVDEVEKKVRAEYENVIQKRIEKLKKQV